MSVVPLGHELLGIGLQLLPVGNGLGALGGGGEAHSGHEQPRQQLAGARPVISHGQAQVCGGGYEARECIVRT